MTYLNKKGAKARIPSPVLVMAAAVILCALPACRKPRPVTVLVPRGVESIAATPVPKRMKKVETQAAPRKPDRVVVGYYPSWVGRTLAPGDIDFRRLTHIVHAFARPKADGGLFLPPGFLCPGLISAAHSSGTLVLLGLGGWGNSAGFPGMVSTAENRARFIGLLVACLRENGYDGVDIDWEFASNENERAGLSLFIEELSAVLAAAAPRSLLTMAAPSGNYWGRWIDFERLADLFDFIGFMTYDYHGAWSDRSGHNAPLRSCHDAGGSLDGSFLYAAGRGVPAAKILLGLPFGGRSFDCGAFGLPFKNCAHMPYSEIAGLPPAEWDFKWDPCAEAPYAVRRDSGMIISYDDPRSVALKCQYVKDKGAAGVIIWELSQDGPAGRHDLLEVVGRSFGTPDRREGP